MNSNRKFVTILELFVITLLVMSVVPVCGLNVSLADISAYPNIVNPGDEIRVTFSGAPGYFWDHIVMYKVGDQDEGEYGEWQVLKGEKSGTLFFTAPDEPGDYEFRLFESFELPYIARSNIVTVQAGTLPTSEEAVVLFEANFDDGYAPGFGNEVGDWEVHLFTGKYTATTDTYRFSMAGDTNWQDYVIEADFFNAQDGGLLVRAQDQDNGIALIVRPSYNDIYWYVRKGGMWADYKGQVTLGHEPGEELQVKVEVVGSEFKAYVNDVLKTTVENTEFPKGKIGLYLYYQPDQYWDNVVVYSSGATGPTPTPTISATPSIANPGDEITVTFSGAPGFELDWIAMYKVGDPNEDEYDMGYYLAGKKSGTLSFTAPDEPGDYEFRLFEDDGYTDIARSNIVRVQEGTTVSTPTPTPTVIDAFRESARKCEPAEMTLVLDDNMEIFYRIEGEKDGYCVLYEKVVRDNTGYGFVGKDMTCNIPIDAVREDTPLPEDFSIKDYCDGPLADVIVERGKEIKGEG